MSTRRVWVGITRSWMHVYSSCLAWYNKVLNVCLLVVNWLMYDMFYICLCSSRLTRYSKVLNYMSAHEELAFSKVLSMSILITFWSMYIMSEGAGIACWSERRTRDRKVASSNPGWSGGRIFFCRVNFVCWLLFGVRSTPMLPQWHVKDPGHSAKSAGGRLHLSMHTPLTQQSWSWLTMPAVQA